VFARIRRPVYPVMQGYLWQTAIVEDECERIGMTATTRSGMSATAGAPPG
jgi:hypothetical protein